jgi:hypothetical protein
MVRANIHIAAHSLIRDNFKPLREPPQLDLPQKTSGAPKR